MKSGFKTSEATATGLGGAGIAALVNSTWVSNMTLGSGIAMGLACLSIAFAVVYYGVSRTKAKGGKA